jgi:hypothetical protein
VETTTNENAVWAYSNTGNLAHAFLRRTADGRLQAACRSSITRNADATVYQSEDISGRLCGNCETRWNAHLARVERSMQPLQPCESFEVYGAAPEQPAEEANYGSCEYCRWSGLLTKDGLMKQHRRAKDSGRTGSTGSLPQDKSAEICKGSGKAPYKPMHEAASTAAPTTSPTRPQQPASKTVIRTDTTWTLQSRKNNTDAWSYVSDHGSEEAATLRAQAFLIEGSRRQFRVIEHRTEVRATDPIEPPKDAKPQPEGPRYVVEPVRLGFAVVDTSTGKPEARMGSRYAANDMADRLNAETSA